MAKIGEKLWKIDKKCPLRGHFKVSETGFNCRFQGFYFFLG